MTSKLKRLKIYLLLLWMTFIAFLIYKAWQSGISLTEMPQHIETWLKRFGWTQAAAMYVLLYTIRPIIFFPATLLTIASGLVFGPIYGILLTIVGENFSANLAFLLGRWFGRDWIAEHENEFMKSWETKLQENGLVTVIVLRFLMLPFDLVNYACGLTSIKQRDYAIGTFVGILPGLIAFVLLGGAASAGNHYKWLTLGGSVFVLLIGFIIAHRIKQKLNSPTIP